MGLVQDLLDFVHMRDLVIFEAKCLTFGLSLGHLGRVSITLIQSHFSESLAALIHLSNLSKTRESLEFLFRERSVVYDVNDRHGFFL